ncbi:MAG: phospholipase D family protein [Pararhodobacter sp.]|nr:phospholipase D family protein [Pararhodobacter sp.]
MVDWLFWISVIAAIVVLGSVVALWSYGRFARRALGPPSQALPPGEDAPLDRLLAPHEAAHPGKSGAMFIFNPYEAFALRAQLTALAARSVDVQYYIWYDDMTGRLLAQALLEAADRGVRVRMLLDDVNVLGRDPLYLALDRHPGVEVRLFNPIRNRERSIRRGVELFFNLVRYNRRMHGKAWIVDGRLALIGGRNVGDVYFGAATGRRRNNDDIDLALAGPVVTSAADAFDDFWNSGLALPIKSLWHKRRTSLSRLRARLARDRRTGAVAGYLERIAMVRHDRRAMGADVEGAEHDLPLDALRWSSATRLVADPPHKALGTGQTDWLPEELMPSLNETESSLRIMTPYLVPGTAGLAALSGLAARGVQVEIVTNALSVNDHVVVHGAYRWYRKALIAAGVRLHEFSARPGRGPWPVQPREMLHGKAMTIDHRLGFAGSFNFDLRSAFLNTEIGVIFNEPALLAELNDRFDRAITPERAFALALNGKRVIWQRGDEAPFATEPDSAFSRRLVSFVVGHLPIHRWL